MLDLILSSKSHYHYQISVGLGVISQGQLGVPLLELTVKPFKSFYSHIRSAEMSQPQFQ